MTEGVETEKRAANTPQTGCDCCYCRAQMDIKWRISEAISAAFDNYAKLIPERAAAVTETT